MAQAAIHHPQTSRMWLLVWPREHGAWGILAVPLATGAAIGLAHGAGLAPFLLFASAALALFCLRTPVESLLGNTPMRVQSKAERRTVAFVLAGFGGLALLALAGLLGRGQNRGLYLLGAVAVSLFIAQTLIRRIGRRARMAAQMVGALALTSTAAGAYYVAAQRFDTTALALWLANWVFACDQVHFVQLRIHGVRLANWTEKLRQGKWFLAGQVLMVMAVALAWRLGMLPALAIIAFAPIFLRGCIWFFSGSEPLRVHWLGVTELMHALAFAGLLIVAFRW